MVLAERIRSVLVGILVKSVVACWIGLVGLVVVAIMVLVWVQRVFSSVPAEAVVVVVTLAEMLNGVLLLLLAALFPVSLLVRADVLLVAPPICLPHHLAASAMELHLVDTVHLRVGSAAEPVGA